MLIVFTTVPDRTEAKVLAGKLVAQKLAACVQILPMMDSIYSWQGKVQTETECLMLIKTLETKYADLEEFVIKEHSYDTPEIVAVRAEKISTKYHKWLAGHLE